MTELGDRLKQARKEAGLKQGELAKRVGLRQGFMSMLERGERDGTTEIALIAAELGVEALWLASGKGPKKRLDLVRNVSTMFDSEIEKYDKSNVELAKALGRIPVISYVQAGAFAEAIDTFAVGEAEEWVETTKPVNRHTFALRVIGDSMEPEFPEGVIIVVEPDLDPLPGDYVIAKNGDEATFKQLVKDGEDWYLKPLNPRYPIKSLGDTRIIGVVREAIRSFR